MTALLLIETLALLAFVVAIVLATATNKVVADRRERRDAALRERVRPAVFRFVSSDGEDRRALQLAFGEESGSALRRVAIELLLEFGSTLRGDVLDGIREFLTEHGVGEAAEAELGSRSAWRRALAAQQLGFLAHTDALASLLRRLADRDSAVRIAVARALGELGLPEAVPHLLATQDTTRYVPYGVTSHALVKIGVPGRDSLLAGLGHPSFRVRRIALDVIGELRLTAAVNPVRSLLLNDGDVLVRIRAARALGRIGTAEVLGELYDSARGDNAEIRQSIVRAVTDIGAQASLPVLRRALSDSDHSTARVAAQGLLELGKPGHTTLQAVAAGPGAAAIYALEALDSVTTISDKQRARVRTWQPDIDDARAFPTTGVTMR